jgi:predicted metal-binding membrane protein
MVVVASLVGLAVLAYYLTARQAADMSSMATGLAQVGVRMPSTMGVPLFMSMWLVMVVAMMLPTVLPVVLTHRLVTLRRGEGWLPSAAFVGGYVVLWTLVGLGPLAAFIGFRDLAAGDPIARWLPTLSGAILIVAGLYQVSPLKNACLRVCRTPFDFIVSHDFDGGWRSGLLGGITHGAYCIGCCWALMAVLLAVGLMNLVWMAVLATIFMLEKNWRHGFAVSRAAAVVVTLLGLIILVDPQVLVFIVGGQPPASAGGHM